MSRDIYTDERQAEILNTFQELLKSADNFDTKASNAEYRKYWIALRGDGAALFGLANYLKQVLDYQTEIASQPVEAPLVETSEDEVARHHRLQETV